MSAFDELRSELKKLPGIGFRAAERIALHLLVEHPETVKPFIELLADASEKISQCKICGNIAEQNELCVVCSNPARDATRICVVEHVPDLMAIERAGTFDGTYHVLRGRLSPIRGVEPKDLNFESLRERVKRGGVEEIILALSNDVEGEATCHYIREVLLGECKTLKISRIGFGLPSGAMLNFADPATLKNALESRREF